MDIAYNTDLHSLKRVDHNTEPLGFNSALAFDKSDTTNKYNIQFVTNTFTFFISTIFIFLSSNLNFLVNWLIFCIVLLFQIRNTLIWGLNFLVRINLYILESIILVNVLIVRLIYMSTGTKVIQTDNSSQVYNSSGFLKLRIIHNQFWSNKNLLFARTANSYSTIPNMSPITTFLDIPLEKKKSEIKEETEEVPMEPIQSEPGKDLEVSHFEEEEVEEDMSIDSEMHEDKENSKHQHYFSFHHRRKSKKISDIDSNLTNDSRSSHEVETTQPVVETKLIESPKVKRRISLRSGSLFSK